MRLKFTILTLTVLLSSGLLMGQPAATSGAKGDYKKAKAYFEFDKNYKDALAEFLKILAEDPADPEINYRVGLCYLMTNVDKKKAYKYLEVMARQPKAPKDVYIELGRAYHLAGRFDDAIKRYSEFIEVARLRPDEAQRVNRFIEQCRIAKKLVENPVDVTFECLGKEVNTDYPELNPFITEDESFMIFTSRRNNVTGGFREIDGQYSSDVFSSLQTAGKWAKAKNLATIVNTQYYEVSTSMTPDGRNVVVYFSNETAQSDIYLLNKKDKAKSFQKATSLGGGVNMPKSIESAGAISPDGQTLIFASDRPGGKGGIDLWRCTLEGGEWSTPENLGLPVNSEADEDYPSFSPDGKTLYFSSNSAKSMGGFDIFSSKLNKATENYDEPQNIGYPINTTDDNQTISFNGSGTVAYVSQQREGGIGDLDIWKVTFNGKQADVKKTRFTGVIKQADSAAVITITDKFTGKEITKTSSAAGTGKYTFELAPGRYYVKIEEPGQPSHTEELPVLSGAVFKDKVEKDFDLLAAPAGTTPGKPGTTKPGTTKPTTPVKKPTTGTTKPKTP